MFSEDRTVQYEGEPEGPLKSSSEAVGTTGIQKRVNFL